MIVVDTNVIAYLYLAGGRSAQAEGVLKKDADWMAPSLWRSELRNVLALYLRKGHLALADAQAIMERAERFMEGGEYQVPSGSVLALAEASGCTAYDCEFVALAQDLDCAL